jgi:hypothetical protein
MEVKNNLEKAIKDTMSEDKIFIEYCHSTPVDDNMKFYIHI